MTRSFLGIFLKIERTCLKISTSGAYDISEFTPFSEIGDLQSLIGNFTILEDAARNLSSQIFSALLYLHSRGIVHGEIRSGNFLIFLVKDRYVVKLCDFGSSFGLKPGNFSRKIISGNSCFFAPEILLLEPIDHSIDIFAAGVINFQVLGGYDPVYPSKEAVRLAPRGNLTLEFPGSCWSHVSDACKKFISGCLWGTANGRPSAEAALADIWFKLDGSEPGNFFPPQTAPNPKIQFWPAGLL